MQILHPFTGSVQQYLAQLDDPQHRPACCPQCQAKDPLTAHGFYVRTLIDTAFDVTIRVRRYLREACRRTVSLSLVPEFALLWLRSSLAAIVCRLVVHLLQDAAPPAPAPRRVCNYRRMVGDSAWQCECHQRPRFVLLPGCRNLQRLAHALAPYHPRPAGFPRALPFIWNQQMLNSGQFLPWIPTSGAATCWLRSRVWATGMRSGTAAYFCRPSTARYGR